MPLATLFTSLHSDGMHATIHGILKFNKRKMYNYTDKKYSSHNNILSRLPMIEEIIEPTQQCNATDSEGIGMTLLVSITLN